MMTPWNECSEVRTDLPLFVGGELELERHEAVAGHLDVCEACSGEAASLRAAMGLLHGLPEPAEAAELDLWPSIRAELASEGRFAPAAPSTAPAELAADPVPAERPPLTSVGGTGGPNRTFRGSILAFAGGLATAAAVLFAVRPWHSSTPAELPRPTVEQHFANGTPTPTLFRSSLGVDPIESGLSGSTERLASEESLGGLRRIDRGEGLPEPTEGDMVKGWLPGPSNTDTHTLASQRIR